MLLHVYLNELGFVLIKEHRIHKIACIIKRVRKKTSMLEYEKLNVNNFLRVLFITAKK